MPDSAVAAQVHQALDRHRQLTPKITLDAEMPDRIANALELSVIEVLDLLVVRNVGRVTDLPCARSSDSVNGGEANLGMLTVRDVDARNSCHGNTLA